MKTRDAAGYCVLMKVSTKGMYAYCLDGKPHFVRTRWYAYAAKRDDPQLDAVKRHVQELAECALEIVPYLEAPTGRVKRDKSPKTV